PSGVLLLSCQTPEGRWRGSGGAGVRSRPARSKGECVRGQYTSPMPRLTSPQTSDLVALSRAIHADPELAYQERRAVDRIAALLEIGHGCGHNLIAISNVGAFLVAAAEGSRLEVGVELIGTPAEESGGGKIDLLRAGVFDRAIAALSSHPASQGDWGVSGTGLGVVGRRVRFGGVASHAGPAPDQGRTGHNALR